MICNKCGQGILAVMRTYNAGDSKTQQRRCNKCHHEAVFVVQEHKGSESAYMLARRLVKERRKRTER